MNPNENQTPQTQNQPETSPTPPPSAPPEMAPVTPQPTQPMASVEPNNATVAEPNQSQQTPQASPLTPSEPVASQPVGPELSTSFTPPQQPQQPQQAQQLAGMTPAGPIGSGPQQQPVPQPGGVASSRSSGIFKNKGLLFGIIAGAVLLVVGVAIAIYFIFFNITKEDYLAAQTQLSSLKDGAITVATMATEDDVAQAQGDLEKFKTENSKLANMKALRVDNDLSKKYKAYDEKAKAYIEFLEDTLPSLKVYAKGFNELSDSSNIEFTSAYFKTVVSAMKEIRSEVTSALVKQFMDEAIDGYERLVVAMEAYERSRSSSDSQKVMSILSDVSKKADEFSQKMKDDAEAVNPESAYNELRDAVDAKLATM